MAVYIIIKIATSWIVQIFFAKDIENIFNMPPENMA